MASDDGKKKKIAVIAVSSLILVVIGVAMTVGLVTKERTDDKAHSDDGSSPPTVPSTSNKAVQTLCQPVQYKEACLESLKGANTSDPKELVKTGFEAIKKHLNEAAKKSTTLKELAKDPRTTEALRSCKDMMDYSIDQLQAAFEKVADDFDFSKIDDLAMDLKVWLSGSLTFQETCLDGFRNTTSDAAVKMGKALNTSMELTNNAITMVNEISSMLTSMDIPMDLFGGSSSGNTAPATGNRRLLQTDATILGHGELPDWLEPTKRRLLALPVAALKPNIIVAKDGSSKYNNINAALRDIPRKVNQTFVLHIKEGVYREKVIFDRDINHVVIVGDGPTKTRIVWNDNAVDHGKLPTDSATLTILGWHFIVRDIGVENLSGPEKHQAVAIRSQSDQSVYYNCRFDGFQDTVYAHANRQFYRDCVITGNIDFVFGAAAAVYQNCLLLIRKGLPGQQYVVTADGRPTKDSPAGTVLHNCTITGDATYMPVKAQLTSHLGRPWKEYSRTVIMQSFIDDIVHPDGWAPWTGTWGQHTCWYGEYQNRGPGSNTARRVNWRCIKKNVTPDMADKYTVGKFILGNTWIPKTGVPFSAGMMKV